MPAAHTLLITPYLNTRAFVHHGAPAGCELRALPPRDAVQAILRGEAVAGVVPVGGLAELGAQVELLGNYGIACPGAAQSVLFFSRRPFERLDAEARIGLTRDSISSVRLLYLLLAARPGTRGLPRPAVLRDVLDGELIIGDAALCARPQTAYPYVIDLAERWVTQQGLPMVFARWVIQRNAPSALRAQLQWWLADFAANEAQLLDRTAAADHARTGLDASAARIYLRGIRTALGPDDLRGQQRYLAELARQLWPAFLGNFTRLTQESKQR
jgi:chorismate dehydratase